MRRGRLPGVAIAVAALTLAAACGNSGDGSGSSDGAAKTVTIGVPAALSGPGAFVGTYHERGFKLAQEYINDNADDLLGSGRNIKFKIVDSTSEPAAGVTQIRSLAADKQVVAIAGPSLSPQALPAGPFAQQTKIPMVVPTANAEGMTDPGNYVFEVSLTPEQFIPVLVKAAVESFKAKTVGVIYTTDNQSGKTQGELAVKLVNDAGGKGVGVGVLSSETNFASAITKFQAAGAEAVLVGLYPDGIVAFERQSARADFKPQYLGQPSLGSGQVIENAEGANDGAVFASDYSPTLDTPANRWFTEAYKKQYNEEADIYTAQAFSTGLLLAQAAKAVDGDITRDSMRDALGDLKDAEVVVGGGKFTFSEERRADFEPVLLKVVPGGATEPFAG